MKASGADGKAADGHTGRFQNRPAGVSLFGQKSDAYKNPYASGTSAAPKNTPTFGKAFTVENRSLWITPKVTASITCVLVTEP